MARELSAAFKASLFSEQTDNDAVVLLTFRHPELAGPEYVSSHADECFSIDPLAYGTTSRGQRYQYLEFTITLPEDADGTPPAFEIKITNIGRELVQLVRSTSEPASVTVEIVSRQSPDLVEAEFPDFELVSAEYDDETVTLGVGIDMLGGEPYPADTFTPAGFRGLF